jgi:hypothetical protein
MVFDITVTDIKNRTSYKVAMLDKVEIHKSQELLADTAQITLPSAQYNVPLDIEDKIHRGDGVTIKLGYKETGLVTEFDGWIQRISTDGGNITLYCEDDLYLMRKSIPNKVFKQVKLKTLLEYVVSHCGVALLIDCTYTWAYSKFVINNATGYDVLKKVQDECGADIYIRDNYLCVKAPGEVIKKKVNEQGKEEEVTTYYDFAKNIEKEDLTYKDAEDKRFEVVVKANMPNGKVKELKFGTTGGDKIEIKCATSDEASMKARAESELKRRSYSGYDGSITTWLIPECEPGCKASIHDADYPKKDGIYYVNSVTTTFDKGGGSRKVGLSFKLDDKRS